MHNRVTLVGLFLLAVSSMAFAGWPFQSSGFIHMRDGNTIEFESISFEDSTDNHLYGFFNDKDERVVLRVQRGSTSPVIEVPITTIKEIVLLKSASSDESWTSGSRIRIVLRNGQKGEFLLAEFGKYADDMDRLKITTFDAFTSSEQQTDVATKNVARIVFGEDFGNAKINPRTGKIWPSDYNFDPYTGQELEWVQTRQSLRTPEGEEVAVAKEYEFTNTGVRVPGFASDAEIQSYKRSAGSAQAQTQTSSAADGSQGAEQSIREAATEYSKTFLDPRSDAQDIQSSLMNLRDKVLDE